MLKNSIFSAAAAKSLQSCLTLCDPIDGSPPGSPVPGILQARTLEWVAISFSNVWKWKVKVKSLSRVWLSATPWTAAHQAPPSVEFSRQEYWSGVPLPSPPYSLLVTPVSLRAIISISSKLLSCHPPIEHWRSHVGPRAVTAFYLIPAHWWTNWWSPPCWQPSDIEGTSSSTQWVLMLLKSGGGSGLGVGCAFQGSRYSYISSPWAWSDQLPQI